MRNITINPVVDKSLLTSPMKKVTADVTAPGGIAGTGPVVVIDNTSDNALVSFRFKFANVKMQAAEDEFDAAGHHFVPGAFVIADANRAALDPVLKELGLSGFAMASAPLVKTHDLDVPRIGYVHSWTRTQDEGWVRAALDHYGVPYTYFGEPKLKEGNLRAKYDVIIWPHGGTPIGGPAAFGGGAGGAGRSAAADSGRPAPNVPIPYKRTAEFQALGYPDSTDDIRGAVGPEGYKALYEFVQQGGTLITEGSTAAILPEMKLTPGVASENPPTLFARGTILRGMITDRHSPLVYGYDRAEVPVYFNSGPVLNAGAGAPPPVEVASAPAGAPNAGPGGRSAARPTGQSTTPMATQLKLSPWDPDHTGEGYGMIPAMAADTSNAGGRGGRGGAGGGGGAGGNAARSVSGLTADPSAKARVVMQFPANPDDMLLSGTLEGGSTLSNRAQLVDESIGQGHVVMFAIRPFWRWQTQGTFAMGFNAILNWNDLDAGRGGKTTTDK